MSICQTGELGEHRLEWCATNNGGGYWRCMNAHCGEIQPALDEHHGG